MSYGDYPDLRGAKKILVIKLRHLGDVLLTGPVFFSLKKALPEAEIDAYIYEEARPMLEGHPAVTAIVSCNREWKRMGLFKRMKREGNLLRAIRERGYDCVINLTEGDRGAIAAAVAGARVRVGLEPKGRWQRKVYTHIAKHSPSLRHAVEKNLDVLRRMGVFPEPEERELFLHVPQEAREGVSERVGEAPFVLIHPTSRWRFKCWPMDRVRQLVQRLLEEGKRVVLTSGPGVEEREMVAKVARGLPVENLAGEISLSELAALIEQSELFITVDSVPFHMANALKKRVVALFGPTSEITWGPWRNPSARIVAQELPCRPCYQDGCAGSKYSDCLHTLSVERVLKELTFPQCFAEKS